MNHPCDGQTDGQTDGIAIAYARFSIYALARKNNTKVGQYNTRRELRIGRLRSNRIRIESGITIRIRIESRIESAVYTA